MDTTELVSWFRMAQIDPYFGTAIQGRFEQAADTIERQAKDIEHRDGVNRRLVKINLDISSQRDAALAEVEQQRKQIGGLEYHLNAARAEVERLKRENNDFREERDLAMSELEPLVEQNQELQAKLSVIPIATGAPRCTLCGVILDGALHKQFCSTCCAR